MTDHSASALIQLIRLGLERQDLPAGLERWRGDARIDLDTKRSLLAGLRAEHGLLTLLRIGEAVVDAPDDPILAALMGARSAVDLVDRWQRLERYVHSRHRTRIELSEPGRMELTHYNAASGEAPTLEEDALVFGMLVGLFSAIGMTGLQAGPVSESGFAFDGNWKTEPAAGDLSRWRFAWSGEPENAPVLPARRTLSARIGAAVEADPSRAWRAVEVAAMFGSSVRSLQRRLGEEGVSLSQVIGASRSRVAARMLRDTDATLAAIGYRAGYADQAHFGRDFKRLTAMTPAKYRADFRRGAGSG